MSDRTTKVTLTAVVTGYIQGLQQAENATKKLAKTTQESAQQQKDALLNVSRTVGAGLLAMGTLAAAGVAYAVKSFADFDSEMAQVKSLAHATSAEMDQLTEAALNAGQQFGYSATEVAQAETELVKAGISITDIMGGALTGALTLAADGQMNVADATQIAAEAMTQFGLKGKDVPHIADLLAAGADKALGSVGDLGQALESGGLVANQFGLSIEETVGTLSAFAQAGLLGETAGTDLRQMLLKLGNPSADAAKTMKDLGISLYDANGQFVGMTNLSGQLHDKMKDLDPATRNAALATIFGSRAIAGANVLYENGAKGIQTWIDKVNDQGFAARQASGKLDSLKGDLQKLDAAFQTALIRTGSGANGVLRNMAEVTTTVLNVFGRLPAPVQQSALLVGVLTAGVGLLGGAFLLGVPKVVAFGAALDTLKASSIPGVAGAAGGLRSALGGIASFMTGPWGLAIGIGATALGTIFVQNALDAQKKVDDFSASLDANTGKLTENTRAVAFKQLQENGGIKAANDLGVPVKLATDAALGDAAAQAAITKALKERQDAFNKASKNDAILADGQGAFLASANDLTKAIGGTNAALKGSLETSSEWLKASGAAKKSQDDLKDSVSKFTDSIDQNGASTDKSSAAYQSNKQALDTLGAKAVDYIATVQNQYQSTNKTAQAQRDMATTIVDSAMQMGMSRDAAEAYTAKLLGIPASRLTTILADASQAQSAIDRINASLASTPRYVPVTIDVLGSGLASNSGGLAVVHGNVSFAGGGTVPQIGGPKSDSVLANLSAGEEVIQNPFASIYRPILKAINAGTFVRPAGYASGGTVAPPTYVPAPQQYATAPSSSASASASMLPVQVIVQPRGGIDLLKYVDVRVEQNGRQVAADVVGGAAF